MTSTQPKKISRRDAIKLLGATIGATALSTLPSKWSKPTLIAGVIPAHAQTSASCSIVRSIADPGTLTTAQDWFLPFIEGPITDAQLTACNFTQLQYVWATNATPNAQVDVVMANDVNNVAIGQINILNGNTSPQSTINVPAWTGNRPYNGIRVRVANLLGNSWAPGAITVTLS